MQTQRQLFLRHNAQTSPSPLLLEFVRANGIWLERADGTKCMDLIAGIGVSNLGHCHPNVVEAVQKQAAEYMHLMVYGEYVQSPQVLFAKALADILPKSLQCTYFVNSGTEAVEGAMKLAKRITGRTEFISFINAYHGSTQGALSLMGSDEYKNGYRPLLPAVQFLTMNNFEDLNKISNRTAAVFLEPIQGEAGVRIPEQNYMLALRERCTDTGAMLVLDEIQTGFGRTGKMFAFEQYGVVPDILLLAKGLGGGMPIGAFISSQENMSAFSHNPVLGHITTFGGHPVSCAAGLATIQTILKSEIIEDVDRKGQLFSSLLKHPAIREIRQKGLMIAVEFDNYDFNKKVIDLCINDGIITDWFLHCSNSMRIAPPLIISDEDIHVACSIIIKNIELTYQSIHS